MITAARGHPTVRKSIPSSTFLKSSSVSKSESTTTLPDSKLMLEVCSAPSTSHSNMISPEKTFPVNKTSRDRRGLRNNRTKLSSGTGDKDI